MAQLYRLAICAAPLFATFAPFSVAVSQQRPNVVLIVADDAGYADFKFMDEFTNANSQYKTPSLDDLASQSARFRNAYTPSSMCAVTRAGLLTGTNPSRFGFEWNAQPTDRPVEGMRGEQVTIMERVKSLGYKTAAIGKWHLGDQVESQPQNQGVDYFYGMWEGGAYYFRNDAASEKIRRGTTEIEWWAEPSFLNAAPDPANGRYLTDAFGDEAAKYISENAGGADPFFLYLPFNAPHSPYQAKTQDLAQFSSAPLTTGQKVTAAMTLAMDRAIGNVMARINDPNGDGDTADSIADNTVIMFMDDNGAPNQYHSNGPLKGLKGQAWEGGIRTPLLVKAPGVAPGVIDQTVTGYDLFSTIEKFAGGTTNTGVDGVDLMPYLTGQVTGDIHESIFFKNRVNFGAIRKGDWKLVKPEANARWQLFKLNPDGTGEDEDLMSQFPEVAAELAREYAAYDVQMDKARNSIEPKVHHMDVWVRRNDVFVNANWGYSGGWRNGDDLSQTQSLSREDFCGQMIMVFTPNNTADYTASNNQTRASGNSPALLAQGVNNLYGIGETTMNELRLEGTFSGNANRKAVINGNPIMLIKSLAGRTPELSLDAMQTGAFSYTYEVNADLILYHDAIIDGDGNANFKVGGAMTDFWSDQPAGFRKLGASTVTLAGANTFTGKASIEGGLVIVSGTNAAINGAAEVTVESGGRLSLQGGLIRTDLLDVRLGEFDFTGGTLQPEAVLGNLTNAGGTLLIGGPTEQILMTGDYSQSSGSVNAVISGHEPNDPALLRVDGHAQLGGGLTIDFDGASQFDIGSRLTLIRATEGISGFFDSISFPTLPAGSFWSLRYSPFAVSLWREAAPASAPFVYADYDTDGDVDGDDFLSWQQRLGGSSPLGDANRDGVVDSTDLNIWQSQFGSQPSGTVIVAIHAVPEPAAWSLALLACAAATAAYRWTRRGC